MLSGLTKYCYYWATLLPSTITATIGSHSTLHSSPHSALLLVLPHLTVLPSYANISTTLIGGYMTLYEEHMQYAKDVLRIREFMYNKENHYDPKLKVNYSYSADFKRKIFKLNLSDGAWVIGDINTYTWNEDDTLNNSTVLSNTSISFIDDDIDDIEIELYTEELHFQHSLMYTPNELRARVVAGALKNNQHPNIKRFRVLWQHVPVLAKLLRYKDNGII